MGPSSPASRGIKHDSDSKSKIKARESEPETSRSEKYLSNKSCNNGSAFGVLMDGSEREIFVLAADCVLRMYTRRI